MKKYAIIKNGVVMSIIKGKDDDSRDWEEHYSQATKAMARVVKEDVGVGWKYKNNEFVNSDFALTEEKQLELWRKSASLSRRRFKIGEALYEHNGTPLVELIEALLVGLPEPTKTIAVKSYEESGSFDRLDPFIVQFSGALGMTDEQVDEFFQYCIDEGWNA